MSSIFSDILHTSFFNLKDKEPFGNCPIFNEGTELCFHPLVQSTVSKKKILVDHRIDEKSKVILNTFNELLSNVFSPVMRTEICGIEYAKSIPEKDFSCLISSLSRIMEIELNLSVIQWIRKCEGIEMPRYYNKVKLSAPVMRVTSRCIMLNNTMDGSCKLEPQTLGNIQYLMCQYQDDFPEEIKTIAPDFLRIYKMLRKERNNASHTAINGEVEFVDFYDNFCIIIKSGWLKTLMDIKERLRGW